MQNLQHIMLPEFGTSCTSVKSVSSMSLVPLFWADFVEQKWSI